MREKLLFVSHHLKHQRCENLLNTIHTSITPYVSPYALQYNRRLALRKSALGTLFHLGASAMREIVPIHLDGIDVFVHPFFRTAQVLHDYHVPLVEEMAWLGLYPLSILAKRTLPWSLRQSKVVIAPNKEMLTHASRYAKLKEYYIIPNYPPKSFYRNEMREKARDRLGITSERVVLFVGGARLREIYGIDLLMKTWFRVKRKAPETDLYILGPYEQLGYSHTILKRFKQRGINFAGRVDHTEIPRWICAADVCISQRTPGFPREFYNIHDSLKLSEYALFRKPIVAAGYLDHHDYISTDTNIEEYSKGIIAALNGAAPTPTPHTWEENIPNLNRAYNSLMSL